MNAAAQTLNKFRTVRRKVSSALGFLYGAILIIVAATAYGQHTLSAFHDMANARKEAITSLLHIEKTLSFIKDIEDGPRGFALTGNDTYLTAYHMAVQSLPREIDRIKAGLAGHEPSHFTWNEFDGLVTSALSNAASIVEERRRTGSAELDITPLLTSGNQAMDQLRAQFARMTASQSAFIEATDAKLADGQQQSLTFSWVASGLTVLLMTLSTHQFLSERRGRRQLAAELRLAHDTLEERVAKRTHELAKARTRIAGFADELDRRIEAERWRLSREVHDQLGPIFTAIRMALMGLPPGTLPPEQNDMLNQSLDSGVSTTRRIAAELRPPLLDDLGLEAAIQHFLSGLFQNSGVETTVSLADQKYLTERQSLSVFRLIQEAGTNVIRHAEAGNFSIQGRRTGNTYEITMADDGKGMDISRIRPGAQGLNNMHERAELLGAQWSIDSQPGTGTRLSLRIPMANETEREIRENTAA